MDLQSKISRRELSADGGGELYENAKTLLFIIKNTFR